MLQTDQTAGNHKSGRALSQPPEIFALESSDLPALKAFTDRAIGEGYYSMAELEEILSKSVGRDSRGEAVVCSLVLKVGGEVVGVRFTYAPGKWSSGRKPGSLNVSKWPRAFEDTGYFQSLFLDDRMQGQGWGVKLSRASIERLRTVGARGVACHSWKESPFNSSSKYLLKMGFKKVAEHPLYWSEVNYDCTRCLKPPCQCTAVEMYLEIDREDLL